MKYRRNSYGSGYAFGGDYDTTGRWRSEAWHMDGGANDEGWHHRFCNYCGTETEHARGGGCVSCDNRIIAARARKNRSNPARDDRRYIFKLFETRMGSLPAFLQSLKEQNEKRCLSPKQIEIGQKILVKHIDSGTLRSYWVAKHRG